MSSGRQAGRRQTSGIDCGTKARAANQGRAVGNLLHGLAGSIRDLLERVRRVGMEQVNWR